MGLTVDERIVLERTRAKYTATLKDEDLVVIPGTTLATLTLTLYDQASGTIINTRDHQNVLNANNVTVSALGVLVWWMQALDNVIVGSRGSGQFERHVALFEWTWGTTGAGKYEVLIDVQQMTEVPEA